jgi:hypothetical protein
VTVVGNVSRQIAMMGMWAEHLELLPHAADLLLFVHGLVPRQQRVGAFSVMAS